jgi:hypothetical protein
MHDFSLGIYGDDHPGADFVSSEESSLIEKVFYSS